MSDSVIEAPSTSNWRFILGCGLCLSSLHLCWIFLIFLGWAQPVMDYIFKIHMLNSPFQIQPFSLGYAAQLIAITFAIGCFYGLVFVLIKRLLLSSR